MRSIWREIKNEQTRRKIQASESKGWITYKKGERISNRYEVYQVRQGGMGKVYICYDHEIRIPLVIKSLLPELFKDENSKVLFRSEAEVWAELGSHNNIVRLIWVENFNNYPYICLQYIDGDDFFGANLEEWMENGCQFKMEDVLNLSIQFCSGMLYAMQVFAEKGRCFVHKDIKPSNLMITHDKTLKINDFGLVTSKEGGTPGYMAPEQIRGENLDLRADIYSFGCVLYEICCRRKVFETTEEEIRKFSHNIGNLVNLNHLNTEPTDPTLFINPSWRFKKEITDIILRCLKKDRNNRFSNFMELKSILESLYTKIPGCKIQIENNYTINDEYNQLISKGISLYNLNRKKESLDCYNKLLDRFPSSSTALGNKGVLLCNLKHFEEAEKCLDKSLELDPGYKIAWVGKAILYVKSGVAHEALKCINKVLDLDPDYPNALLWKSNILHQMKRTDEALDCCNRALDLYPEYSMAIAKKSNILMTQDKLRDALECINKAIDLNPDSSVFWFGKSNIYEAMGMHDDMAGCLEKGIEIIIKNKDFYSERYKIDVATNEMLRTLAGTYYSARHLYNEGNKLVEAGRIKDAIIKYNKSIMTMPEYAKAWYNKGRALMSLQQPDKAIAYFDKALEINPCHEFSWNNKGLALYMSGKAEEALACFEKAIFFYENPEEKKYNQEYLFADEQQKEDHELEWMNLSVFEEDHARAWHHKGNVLFGMHRFKEALACYEKALELKPRYINVRINKCAVLNNLNRFEEALADIDKVLDKNPDIVPALVTKGVAMMGVENYLDSMQIFLKVLQIDDECSDAAYYLGLICIEFEDIENAMKFFITASELGDTRATEIINRVRQNGLGAGESC